MTANEKLTARIQSLTTEQLVEVSLGLTMTCTTEAIIVCNCVERELEKRMGKAEFLAHMAACEDLLDAA